MNEWCTDTMEPVIDSTSDAPQQLNGQRSDRYISPMRRSSETAGLVPQSPGSVRVGSSDSVNQGRLTLHTGQIRMFIRTDDHPVLQVCLIRH